MTSKFDYTLDHELLSQKASGYTVEETIQRVFFLVVGILRFHQDGYVHGAIRPTNIVFTSGDLALRDFGNLTKEEEAVVKEDLKNIEIDNLFYMAPEQLQDKGSSYDSKADVFAVGCIFYEMLFGKHPYGKWINSDLALQMLKIGEYDRKQLKEDDEIHSLLSSMLNADPTLRPSMLDIIEVDIWNKFDVNAITPNCECHST